MASDSDLPPHSVAAPAGDPAEPHTGEARLPTGIPRTLPSLPDTAIPERRGEPPNAPPTDRVERIRQTTATGGLFELPSGFDERDGDWNCVLSADPFEVLYLDRRQHDLINGEMLRRHFLLFAAFWAERVRMMDQGNAKTQLLQRFGGEGASERVVRAHPEKVRKAYELLSPAGGLQTTFEELERQRREAGERRLADFVKQALIDGLLDPAEMRGLLDQGRRGDLNDHEICAYVGGVLREGGFEPVGNVTGATGIDMLLAVEWMTPARHTREVIRRTPATGGPPASGTAQPAAQEVANSLTPEQEPNRGKPRDVELFVNGTAHTGPQPVADSPPAPAPIVRQHSKSRIPRGILGAGVLIVAGAVWLNHQNVRSGNPTEVSPNPAISTATDLRPESSPSQGRGAPRDAAPSQAERSELPSVTVPVRPADSLRTHDSLAAAFAASSQASRPQELAAPSSDPANMSATVGGLSMVAVSAGTGGFTCALTTSAAAYCWGSNEDRQLGNVRADPRLLPVPVSIPGGERFGVISAGYRHVCGVTADGRVLCWGDNSHGQLGHQTSDGSPGQLTGAAALRFTTVSSGRDHTCGVTTEGTAYCWGSNDYHQLGTGSRKWSVVPVAVAGGLQFATVSAGYGHSCGVTTTGLAYCWGGNMNGSLGTGNSSQDDNAGPVPVAVAGGLHFRALSVSLNNFTCGLTTGGSVYCWGNNESSQLGAGVAGNSPIPISVASGLRFIAVSVGTHHACAVASDGSAYCWGENLSGELGDGTLVSHPTPNAVSGGLKFVSISAGSSHTCGVTINRATYCWGSNTYLALGNTRRGTISVPVAVHLP